MNKSKQVVRVDDKSTKQVRVSNHDPRKVWGIIGGVLGLIFVVAICVIIGYESFHKDPIVTVDGTEYKIDDPVVKFNIYMGEANLQNTASMYAQYYGMSEAEYYQSYLSTAKSSALTGIEENIVMYLEAVKNGEKLSDEDTKSVTEDYGKIYDKMSKSRKRALGLSKEEFVEQALHMSLASQYINKLTEGYNITADTITTPVDKSKYDERSFEVIQVKTTTTDDKGNSKDISAKKKKTYLAQMNKYLEQAQSGKDLSKLVSEDDSKTYTYTTKSLLTTDTTYADLMKKIKDMKDKEVYKSVIEADGYLWVVKMTDNDITTQYDSAVQSEISSEQQAKLDEDIAKAKESYKVKEGKGWDKVDFGNEIVKQGDDLQEFQADPTPSADVSATPEATEDASATPEATDSASATPEATASPAATK